MTHDEEMWQDYDYHQNTGELPEYFDEDDSIDYVDAESPGDPGPDYIPIHARCPRCGSWSAMLLTDGTYSCLYCGTNFYNDRIIPPVREVEIVDEVADEEDEVYEEEQVLCLKCGSDNTEVYEDGFVHCLNCDCWTHPSPRCGKCHRYKMSLLPDGTWKCLACHNHVTDPKKIENINFRCSLYPLDQITKWANDECKRLKSKK